MSDELGFARRWALSQRSEVYAHTGDPQYRPVIGLDDDRWIATLETEEFFEGWFPPDPFPLPCEV